MALDCSHMVESMKNAQGLSQRNENFLRTTRTGVFFAKIVVRIIRALVSIYKEYFRRTVRWMWNLKSLKAINGMEKI